MATCTMRAQFLFVSLLLLFLLSSAHDAILFEDCSEDDYYQSLPQDTELWTREAIGSLLKSTHRRVLPYTDNDGDDVWKALIDLDPGQANNTVDLIYRDVDASAFGYGQPDTWNREHVWPKSRGVGEGGADFTDIHHLRPSDWNVNAARSNLFFGTCGLVSPLGDCRSPAHPEAANSTAKDSVVFLPPEDRRGDIARSLFYMDLRYFGGAGDVDLQLTDCPLEDDEDTHQMAYLSQLLEWHEADGVSAEEEWRNQRACERWQGNRNIFVDKPWLVSQIYGPPQNFVAEVGYQCSDINGTVTEPSVTCGDFYPGDIAVVALSSDSPDSVTLVTLEALSEGLQVYMTDNAWTGGSFLENEGTLKFTVPQGGIARGGIFKYQSSDDVNSAWESAGGRFNLATGGDTVILYCRDDRAALNVLGGLSFSGDWSEAGEPSYSTDTSALPDNLIGFAPALPHLDNYVYEGPTEGTKEFLQSALNDPMNWRGSNSEALEFQSDAFVVSSAWWRWGTELSLLQAGLVVLFLVF